MFNFTNAEVRSGLVCMTAWDNPRYLESLLDFANRFLAIEGRELRCVILNSSSSLVGPLKRAKIRNQMNLTENFLRESFPKKVELDLVEIDLRTIPKLDILNETETLQDLILLRDFDGQLGRSIASIIATDYLKTATLSQSIKWVKKAVQVQGQLFLAHLNTAIQLFGERSFDFAVIQNGRAPSQTGLSVALKSRVRNLYYLEHDPQAHDRYFLANFQINDRYSMQKYIEGECRASQEELDLISEEWVQKITTNQDKNPYISLYRDSTAVKSYKSVFFTSSVDETFAVEGYGHYFWKSQADVVERLGETRDYGQIAVRIHPRALTRHWKELLAIIKSCKRNDIDCFLPNSSVSSFKLMELAENVIVWHSSIGLLAILKGKKTYPVAENEYDILCHLDHLKPSDDFISRFDEVKLGDAQACKKFIYMKESLGIRYTRAKSSQRSHFLFLEIKKSFQIQERNSRVRARMLQFANCLLLPWRLSPGEVLGICKRLFGETIGNLLFNRILYLLCRFTV